MGRDQDGGKSRNGQTSEGMIDQLEGKLEQIEIRLSHSQAQQENLQQDCLEIQDKLNQNKEKYKRAALLFADFLDDLLHQRSNILHEDIKMDHLKNIPFEDLTKESKIEMMLALLKQMQPYFSVNNLAVVGQYHNQSTSYQQSILESVKFAREVQHQHQESKMTSREEQIEPEQDENKGTLNNMLDNIKVQAT